jgi:hypothetical protein
LVVPPSYAWKLVLAVALGAAIFASAYAKAPRRSVPGSELRRMVAGALVLYGVGTVAVLSHHGVLAVLLYAAGIPVLALAAWLSRGSDSGGGPRSDEPGGGGEPPPDPDGLPAFDWAAFEREFSAYAGRREHAPVGQ